MGEALCIIIRSTFQALGGWARIEECEGETKGGLMLLVCVGGEAGRMQRGQDCFFAASAVLVKMVAFDEMYSVEEIRRSDKYI